jgi:cytoskeleton protein RodZ
MTAMEGPPTHPKTFGEELRRLREGAGLSVDDIAAETKISKRILNNLEEGEFRFLPQKVFSRNFVTQYATIVGADPYRLAESFEAAWERFILASGAHPRFLSDETPLVRSFRWSFWLPVGLAAAILVIATIVIVRGSAPGEQLGAAFVPSPSSQPLRRVSPTARAVTEAPPIQIEERAVAEDKIKLVAFTVRVRQDRECWIHYRDRDGVAGGQLLAGGTEERIVLGGPVKLTIGDADAVSLEVADVVYEDLGRPGQVVHTEVRSDGLVILGARVGNE